MIRRIFASGAIVIFFVGLSVASRHTSSPSLLYGILQSVNYGESAPVSESCDSKEEKGTFYQDTGSLYVCFDSGWKKFKPEP